MNSTEQEIIDRTKNLLDSLGMGIIHEDADYSVYRDYKRLGDGTEKEVIVVSFWASPVEFADRPIYFAVMESETEEFLYIITPHGYIEVVWPTKKVADNVCQTKMPK